MDKLSIKRPKNKVKDKLLELGLASDRKELRKKRAKDPTRCKKKSKKGANVFDEEEGEVMDPIMGFLFKFLTICMCCRDLSRLRLLIMPKKKTLDEDGTKFVLHFLLQLKSQFNIAVPANLSTLMMMIMNQKM